ncbi:MAG TPA: HlyD family secretion protein [Steroidobacteraceae bacterium]|nr:HlyD family secretion protein [Steroidobacteraceae bacterium]
MAEKAFWFDWRRPPDWLWRAAIFVIALGLLTLITTRWNSWESDAAWQSTDDAYLQSDLTPIAARVSGYVRSMPVEDYERVRAGQVLAQIVDDDYKATVAQLTGAVAAAAAQIETLKAQQELQHATIESARAAVAASSANLEQNTRDIRRQERLLATGSSSTETGEKLQTTHAQLTAQLDGVRAQALAAQRQLTVLAAQQSQAQAALAAQQANLEIARINLGYTQIRAPADGVLGQRQIKPGQFVGVGGQITTLTPLPRVWVIANYKETQLTHMSVGDAAQIRVDTFPGRELRGHVIAFSPGAGSQFALLPPDNATGNFTKVVQRVAVKIAIDDADGLTDQLRPGLSVIARVNTRQRDRP